MKLVAQELKKQKGYKKKLDSDAIQAMFMLTPQVIGFVIFGLYPILWVLGLSWFDYDGFEKIFIGFDNFRRAFQDQYYWHAVANTFIFTAGKLVLQIPIALVVAVILNHRIKGQSTFRTIMFLPNVVSVAIIGLIFYFLFATFDGVINNLLLSAGLIEAPINWFGDKWTSMFVLVLASVWHGVGISMLYFLTGLQNIPEQLYECARIDGANKLQQLFKITLPMLAPIFQVVLMLALIGSFKVTDLVLVLTDGGPAGSTEVMMTYVFKYFFSYGESEVSQIGYASSLGLISAHILGLLTVVYLISTNKMSRGKEE